MVDLRSIMPTYDTLEEALAEGGVSPAGRVRPG
jgi:hypothetical protein